ncbi:MAG: hypothetical protein ACRC0E_07965 [Soonwooa sp.]
MNNAHLHLVVNHLPIIFPIVGIILLLIGIFIKSDTTKRNSYLVFILGAAASMVAMATGEGAEKAVENLPGISRQLIKIHEESAELFAGLSYVLGSVSALSWFADFRKYSFAKFLPFAVLLLSLATIFFAQKVGTVGGEIRHTEIRNNTAYQIINQNTENGGEAGKDQDD